MISPQRPPLPSLPNAIAPCFPLQPIARRKVFVFVLVTLLSSLSPLSALEFANFSTVGYEGKGELEFLSPEDLVLGPGQEIIVADQKNNRIQVLKPDGTFLRFISLLPSPTPAKTASGTAPASATKPIEKAIPPDAAVMPANIFATGSPLLDKPAGLALDGKNRLFVTTSGNHRILVFDYPSASLIGVLSGPGRIQGLLDIPADIDVNDDGWIAVADTGNRRVQIFDSEGRFQREIHYKEETKKKELKSIAPKGVLWIGPKEVLVSYPTFHQVACWNVDGRLLWGYGSQGNRKGELNEPSYMTLLPNRDILISDSRNHRIVEITSKGMFVKNFPISRGSGMGKLYWPRGLALRNDEILVVSEQGNNRVHFLKPSRSAVLLREVRGLAQNDKWDEALPKIEEVLNLQPNEAEARGMMVNALHFFGDRAFAKGDFEKSEEFFRRVLIYNPNDSNVQPKLNNIFWAEHKDLITQLVFGIIAIIFALLVLWVAKHLFNRLVFGHY